MLKHSNVRLTKMPTQRVMTKEAKAKQAVQNAKASGGRLTHMEELISNLMTRQGYTEKHPNNRPNLVKLRILNESVLKFDAGENLLILCRVYLFGLQSLCIHE